MCGEVFNDDQITNLWLNLIVKEL